MGTSFEENTPVYMEVAKDGITLHLSEHHGMDSPTTQVVYTECKDVKEYHKELIDKKYKYNRPGLRRNILWGISFYGE